MIKTLNMIEAGGNVPIADGRKKFSRMMLIEDIEEHPDFKALYKIDEGVLERIVKSMKESGFDESQPVHIWLTEDGHKYLIDGYTRFTASKKAGITSLPVYEHNFKSFDETYKYVLGLQVNRRNLDGDELLRNVAILSKCNFVKNSSGYKAERTQGCSRSWSMAGANTGISQICHSTSPSYRASTARRGLGSATASDCCSVL